MHVIYISKYMKDGVMIADRFCIYDKRSPADDLKCFDPVINLEDSKAGSVSITLPVSHVAYNYIVKSKTMLSVYRLDDDPNYEGNLLETLIFEGPVRKETTTFNKDKNIYVEGFFSFLNETIQPRREFFNVTLHDFMSALISTHNERMVNEPTKQFILGNVEINYPDVDQKGTNKSEYESTNFGTTMEYFLSIQEKYGGHYIFSKEGGTYRIDYVKDLPRNENQEILFGENLLDLMSENDLTDICSAVVPISSISGTSLGTVGEVIVSTDTSKIPSRYHLNPETDEANRSNSGVYENWGTPQQKLIARIYDGRRLVQKDGDSTRGAYDIGPLGSVGDGNHVIRYFVDGSVDRVYLSSRLDTGGFNGFWCFYAYDHATDLLDYRELDQNEEHWDSIVDEEIDISYSSSGAKHYTDRSNGSVGEILIGGYGSGIPTAIKASKYSYASDPEVGDILMTYGYTAEGVTGQIWYNQFLYRDQNQDPTYYGDPHDHGAPYPDPGNSMIMCVVEMAIPAPEDRDYDSLLITTRTRDYSSPEYPDVYIGDCLWVLYYHQYADLYQLNYERIDSNNVFTSVINYKIDLTDPKNVGADTLRFTCFGLRPPGDPDEGEAPIVPVIRKCKKYVGKTSEYLTVEGADPTEYHDSGSLVVKDDALVAKYGYIERRLEFSGIEDPNVLEKRSEAYLHDVQFGNVRIDAKAVDLHDSNVKIDALDISTSVRCRSYPHNIDRFFEIKSLTLNLDYPLNNSVSFAEENQGYYKGTLPVSVLTTTNELRNFKVYGTTNGLITPGGASVNDIHITIHNLISDTSQTIDITRSERLIYPDYVTIGINGTYTDFEAGLIEITTTSMDSETGEYPMVEFEYDKTKDGE